MKTPDDVFELVRGRHDTLFWMIAAVLVAVAAQIVVKVVIFARLIQSNRRLANENRLLMEAVSLSGVITDAQKVRTEKALAKVEQTVQSVQTDHEKIDDTHRTVKRIDEKLPDHPSGVTANGA